MNLENLNQIAIEEKELLEKARRLNDKANYLAKKRQEMTTLSEFIVGMKDRYSFENEINEEVKRVSNALTHDIFRSIEMKFAAEARELRIEAYLKNQQIKNFLPDSEVQ